MKIIESRSAKTFAGPGIWAYDTEVQFELDGEVLFAHAHYNCGEHYTIADESIFEYMTGELDEDPGVSFMEEYEDLDDAEVSEYYEAIVAANNLLEELY